MGKHEKIRSPSDQLFLSMTLQFAKPLASKRQPSAIREAGTQKSPLFAAQSTVPQFSFPAYWWVSWLLLVNSVPTGGKLSDISEGNTKWTWAEPSHDPKECDNVGMKQWRLLPALRADRAWNSVWLILQERFHKGPNPPKHENHTGSYQRGSQIQCREGLGSTGWLPRPLDKLVCVAIPAKTRKYSTSKVGLGELKPRKQWA